MPEHLLDQHEQLHDALLIERYENVYKQYTTIEPGIVQCVDCGAHARRAGMVRHVKNCIRGSSAKWERYYNG